VESFEWQPSRGLVPENQLQHQRVITLKNLKSQRGWLISDGIDS